MAEMAEEGRARGRGARAIMILTLVALIFTVLITVGYFLNENKRSGGDGNTETPMSMNGANR